MPNDAQQDFLKDLEPGNELDAFNQPITPVEAPQEQEQEEEDGEEARNRRERRLQAKLKAERESSIALAAKLEVLTEAQKFARESNPEYDEAVARIWGTDTPEATAATELLQKAIRGAEERATQRALEAFRAEQQQAAQEVAREEQNLDSMIEDIEDTFNVSLDPATQKAFFQQLEKLSPKDRDGNVIEYADPYAVWEGMQSRRQPADTRAKDLASRSMTRTGSSPATGAEDDAALRFLKENGII